MPMALIGAGRGNDVDRIAEKDTETHRQLLAENDAGFFG